MKTSNFKDNYGQIMDGPIIMHPEIFSDSRGFFQESWNKKSFSKIVNSNLNFVQDNHSKSYKNVLRGLHYQTQPFSQGKLIRCIDGEIYDVIVDLRTNSDTFKQWGFLILSARNNKQLWIPDGFAHGYFTLSEKAEIIYKTTNYWSPEHERCINWADPLLAINWPLNGDAITSEKDSKAPFLSDKTDYFCV